MKLRVKFEQREWTMVLGVDVSHLIPLKGVAVHCYGLARDLYIDHQYVGQMVSLPSELSYEGVSVVGEWKGDHWPLPVYGYEFEADLIFGDRD